MKKHQTRFKIEVNEGAFFYEPWLIDTKTGKNYKYDEVPVKVQREFAATLRSAGVVTPEEVRMIIDFVSDREGSKK